MNDYWNDPPEEPDFSEISSSIEDWTCRVEKECPVRLDSETGRKWREIPETLWQEINRICGWDQEIPIPPLEDKEPIEPCEGPKQCPHGKEWGECNVCDYLSDIAYDSAREARHFGR